jgi:hypothetical protein
MAALRDLVELVGWDGLTAAEQTLAIYGAAAGLAVALVVWVLFGGRGRR